MPYFQVVAIMAASLYNKGFAAERGEKRAIEAAISRAETMLELAQERNNTD